MAQCDPMEITVIIVTFTTIDLWTTHNAILVRVRIRIRFRLSEVKFHEHN